MRKFTEIDKNILEVAQKVFIEKGIFKTEMCDIAKCVGCSRSTLYRHFNGKEVIMLYLAIRAIDTILMPMIIPKNLVFSCGYDQLEWQMRCLTKSVCEHVEEIIFIRDFDCVYTVSYPLIPETGEFVQLMSAPNHFSRTSLKDAMKRGIKDGSIRNIEDIDKVCVTLVHSTLAIAERIMPRETQNVKEHGYGRNLVECTVEMMLNSLKNDVDII